MNNFFFLVAPSMGLSQQGSNSSTDRKRKKPTTVAGPYIVYMLREPDIVDDWTMIKKALTASKRKTKCMAQDSGGKGGRKHFGGEKSVLKPI